MKFINANEHIVIDLDGKLFVVDTGAPGSFNFDLIEETIILDNNKCKLGTNTYGVSMSEGLENLIGRKLYGFIGMDIIKELGMTVDYENCEIVFNSNEKKEGLNYCNVIIKQPLSRVIITDSIFINGIECKNFIFDTGAITSYILRKYLKESRKTDEVYNDFHPQLGKMRGYYYEADIKINGLIHKGKFADADDYHALANAFKMDNKSGVVGLSFISDKGFFVFDFKENKIWFK